MVVSMDKGLFPVNTDNGCMAKNVTLPLAATSNYSSPSVRAPIHNHKLKGSVLTGLVQAVTDAVDS